MIYQELTVVAALLAGLLGSTHCLGMCGGIAGALGMSTGPRSPVSGMLYALLFNFGRIGSYALAGLIAGGIGLGLANLLNYTVLAPALRVATGLIMAAIGLQLAFNWRGLRRIEQVGARLWKRLAPLTGRLLPVKNPPQALALGLLWGWLPCGLVYTMLLAAATSGSPLQGAAVMAGFGAGTLPALTLAGAAAGRFRGLAQRPALRRVAGVVLLGFGVWTIFAPTLLHGADHGLEGPMECATSMQEHPGLA